VQSGTGASATANIRRATWAEMRCGLDCRVSDSGCVTCAGSSGSCETEEHHESTRESDRVVVAQLANAFAQL